MLFRSGLPAWVCRQLPFDILLPAEFTALKGTTHCRGAASEAPAGKNRSLLAPCRLSGELHHSGGLAACISILVLNGMLTIEGRLKRLKLGVMVEKKH
mgnify:CR=1 FL=1